MSKANQKFVQADEAVSPVIGVILMVAITVVLAAVVFVLVSNLGKTSSSTPTFSLSRDEANDRLSVTSADSDADWNRVAVRTGTITSAGSVVTHLCFEADTDPSTDCDSSDVDAYTSMGDGVFVDDTNANFELTATAHLMSAGSFMGICAVGGAVDATGVTLTLVDTTANSVIGSFTFSTIAQCA